MKKVQERNENLIVAIYYLKIF